MGSYWQESLDEWHERWCKCGGKLFDGRMIAATWNIIWGRLSQTFYDGLSTPYPPYARSSCARWTAIGQDEAIVIGVISEQEHNERIAQLPPPEPFLDKDGKPIPTELLVELARELEKDIYRHGGPPPGATRAERVAHERKRQEESEAKMQADYEKRKAEGDERVAQNSVFRLLEEVEGSLRSAETVQDPRRREWLVASLGTLTNTPYFDRYPNWRARAWLAQANLHEQTSNPMNELACLEKAIAINAKLPIKKRIKKLQNRA